MKITLIILSVLTGILGGEYKARTLTAAQQDSIFGLSVISYSYQQPSDVSTRYRLERENEEKLFRRSTVADWYIVDTQRNIRKQLGAGLFIQNGQWKGSRVRDAVMSPNGRYIAFARDNNLYIHKLDFGSEIAVTKDENTDLINGVADWLYEEEFGTTALFAWSPDSKQLAFVRLDETDVPVFTWTMYQVSSGQVPSAKENPQYPLPDSLRYPKAGCPNARATVCVYDVATKGIIRLEELTNVRVNDFYFPRLRWASDGMLLVLRVNRDQNKLEVFSCNTRSTVTHPLYKEESNRYFIDYTLFDEWQWLSDGSFIALSERDGWRRAYLHDGQGMLLRPLTPEKTDVTALYHVDESGKVLYYQAAPEPSTRQVYAASLAETGNRVLTTQLTEGEGIHAARFSTDHKWMIDCFQSFDTPNIYTLYAVRSARGSAQITKRKVLLDNEPLAKAWRAKGLPEPQLLRIPNGKGQELEAMLLTSDKGTKYQGQRPLVLMHYSGPQSQRVLNRWRKRFEYALAEEGYAVLIVDPRGSDCRGREWRNETYMSLGTKEAEDLIAAANYIGQRSDIDASRMAILGWSYGGYETLFTMTVKGHPFKAGVAIAPVTDWRLYDSAYTERYMRRPQVNDKGYQEASLIPRAAGHQGALLLIHGTGDDNVHVQHSMQYINALVQADKQFEMQLYPDDNHFLKKGNNAKHMHERVLGFLSRVLK